MFSSPPPAVVSSLPPVRTGKSCVLLSVLHCSSSSPPLPTHQRRPIPSFGILSLSRGCPSLPVLTPHYFRRRRPNSAIISQGPLPLYRPVSVMCPILPLCASISWPPHVFGFFPVVSCTLRDSYAHLNLGFTIDSVIVTNVRP